MEKNTISKIAAAIEFIESQQAFTNIFTAMYKQSPNKYRAQEKFYPLQLEFRLDVDQMELGSDAIDKAMIRLATDADVNCWLELVRLVIDGFPHWDESEYCLELRRRIQSKQAFILKDGAIAIGIMMFNRASGSIDFMGTHPLYRKRGIPQVFIDRVLMELEKCSTISTTSYRAGDRADTGHRQAIKELGFAEAELLMAFGKSKYLTMGVIVKTNSAAKELYEILVTDYKVQLITPESNSFTSWITVMSVLMSKGLEFDEVLVADADSSSYYSEYDRNLLYIAATRAIHRLTFVGVGDLAHFV